MSQCERSYYVSVTVNSSQYLNQTTVVSIRREEEVIRLMQVRVAQAGAKRLAELSSTISSASYSTI